MKKDINSNRYIFLYATVLIVVVAVLLTVTALWLQPFQDRNAKNEKRINILTAAGIPNVNKDNAALLFEQHCTSQFLLDENGNPSDDGTLPLFVIDRRISVIPMKGNGLWGPISGYLAIDADGSTIIGANFDHKSETPGLGGEITTEKFQSQFSGKQIMENGRIVPIEIDAITGATKTSDGVKEMIDNTLEAYAPFLNKIKATAK